MFILFYESLMEKFARGVKLDKFLENVCQKHCRRLLLKPASHILKSLKRKKGKENVKWPKWRKCAVVKHWIISVGRSIRRGVYRTFAERRGRHVQRGRALSRR